MPSATRMFTGGRRRVALPGGLATAPGRAAPSTSTPTLDPSTVPPPPAFSLPLDYGLKLLAQRAEAGKDLLKYGAALADDRKAAQAAQAKWNVLQRKLTRLEA